jgi:ATP-dependent DNA helicase RecG
MIEELLGEEEGKTVEFKENTNNLEAIIHTVIAFANTAGGKILIGVKNKGKEIVGLKEVLREELKLANAIADSITPLPCPDIHVISWRDKELLLVCVSHGVGPYYLKSRGLEKGTFIRLGSTNRLADSTIISELHRLNDNECFDETPAPRSSLKDLDMEYIQNRFKKVKRRFTEASALSLRLFLRNHGKLVPSKGAILLFGKNREEVFPEAVIRCVRFLGTTKENVLDHQDIHQYPPDAIETILAFIRRNTRLKAEFGELERRDIPEYPLLVVREAVTNAVVHSDYSMRGSHIQIAIFDDRLEIINPGNLPFGLTLKDAIQGFSQLRNRVIGRVFRELKLIEQWGSGLRRMIEHCKKLGLKPPLFEEIGYFFRITLFNGPIKKVVIKGWQKKLVDYLTKHQKVTTKEAAKLFKISDRTARTRLKQMVLDGIIVEMASHAFDPQKCFTLHP